MVTNRSAPTATIVPILIYEDVRQAIDWLCRALLDIGGRFRSMSRM